MLTLLLIQTLVVPPCEGAWNRVLQDKMRSTQDTAEVITSLADRRDECAALVSAYLSAFLTDQRFEQWKTRLEARQRLDRFIKKYPDNARLYLARGYLNYQQGMKIEAGRMLARAEDRVARTAPALTPREHAVIAFLRGRVSQDDWRDWRSFGQLMGLASDFYCEAIGLEISEGLPPPGPVQFNVGCPKEWERIMDDDFRLNADMKQKSRDALEKYYRQSISIDPSYIAPALALAGEFAFEANWGALKELAAALREPFPNDYRPLAFLGLVANQTTHADTARALFDQALALMDDDTRQKYVQPEVVLSVAAKRTFAGQPAAIKDRLSGAYWRSREVLFLTDENERLLAHYARMTAADLIFGNPMTGARGWNSDAGEVWIRYGRPLKIRDLSIKNGRASFWSYGPDPDFVFQRFLTFSEYHVHEQATGMLEQMREQMPARFRPEFLDSVVALDRQLVRFRSPDGRGELLVLAPYPETGFKQQLETGVTLLDAQFKRLARWRREAREGDGFVLTFPRLKPRRYNVVVEAWSKAERKLSQSRDSLSIAVPDSTLATSDLLLLRQVDGSPDASRWNQLDRDYLYGTTLKSGSSLGLAWEIYNLATDSSGTAHYRIEVEVKSRDQRGFLARIVSSVGRGFKSERPTTTLSYERTVLLDAPQAVEWLNLTGEWSPGQYLVTVTVSDTARENAAVQLSRTVTVR